MTLLNGFVDMRLEFFVDLADDAIIAKDICQT
jgi:hypothetical protein